MKFYKSLGLATFALSSIASAATLSIESASDWGGGHSSYPASKTIDGSLAWSSRWAAQLGGDAVSLELDLGSVQTVDDVGISFGRGDSRTYNFEIWARASTSDSWVKVRASGDSTGTTSSIESYNVDDIDARYVRIKTHSNSAGSNWTDIKEVEVYGTDSSGGGDTGGGDSGGDDGGSVEITASASSNDGNVPANVLDGSLSTRWSANGSGEWLTLDLGQSQQVGTVNLAFFKGDQRNSYFSLQTSTNNSSWNTVLSNETSSGGTTGLESFSVETTTARYVRYVGQGNSSNTWNSLTEMSISSGGGDTGGGDTGGGDDGGDTGGGTGGDDIPSNITNGSIFDLEGDDPHPLVNSSTLEFVALETKVTTPNGNGWRHEYKIESNQRVAMTDTYEFFQADVKVELSDGGKSIIAQHHAGDTGTIMKLYVADSSESGIGDSNPDDGVFGVYVRIRNTSGNEEKKSFGTIRSGDSFTFTVENDYGVVTVSAMGSSFGTEVEDDSESYFKFGNYLQSQYPDGSKDCGESGDSDSFADCFKDIGITKAKVTMTDVSYERTVK